MNFRPYDILTQLIPGVLIVGFVAFATRMGLEGVEFNLAFLAFATAVSFMVGYIINGFGHFIESVISPKLSSAVLKSYISGNVLFPLNLLKPFTKLKFIEGTSYSLPSNYSQIFDRVKAKQHERLDWLNQDKKFARSLIVTSIVLVVFCLTMELNLTLIKYNPIGLAIMLGIVALYRYFQCSIDYTIWIIKFYQNKNVWDD